MLDGSQGFQLKIYQELLAYFWGFGQPNSHAQLLNFIKYFFWKSNYVHTYLTIVLAVVSLGNKTSFPQRIYSFTSTMRGRDI